MIFLLCSSDSEKSERKAKKEDKKKKVMPGPVHFGSNEPVILAELDPQVCYIFKRGIWFFNFCELQYFKKYTQTF